MVRSRTKVTKEIIDAGKNLKAIVKVGSGVDNSSCEEFLKSIEAKLVSLEELLRKSDVITIHVPLTPQTYHMIGGKEIQQMKDGVYIINTSRGAVIDEKALFNALRSGKIAGAALDVYEKEPPEDYLL